MKIKNKERWALGGIGLLAYGSGLVLFILSRWIRVTTIVGEQHLPMERWIRVGHSTLTYFVVLAVGYLVKSHILPGLKQRKKRISGISILFLFGTLLGTALITLYAGEGEWVASVALIHALIGILSPLLLLGHLFNRRVSSRIARPAPGSHRHLRSVEGAR